MAERHHSKVLIIGSGPAGYTAAIYAARANLKPTLVAGLQPGGQMTITTDVENYPGFADVIQGPWLMEQMQKQAENVGTRMVHDIVNEVDFGSRPFTCTGDSGDVYTADAVIIATGAQARWLGLDSEQKYMGFGVSACATCDGFFFREQEVAIVGCDNVERRIGNGYNGWPDHGPYDRIMVAAAPELVPPPLIAQLKPGGRMVLPAGLDSAQQLMVVDKDEGGRTTVRDVLAVRFAPMEGTEL